MSIDKHTAISAQLDFMPGKAEVVYQAPLGPRFHPDVRSLPHALTCLHHIPSQHCLILSAASFLSTAGCSGTILFGNAVSVYDVDTDFSYISQYSVSTIH